MKHSMYYTKITRIFYFLFFLLSISTTHYSYELRWDWNQINLNELFFPSSFLWGCADSALQTEGTESANGKIITNSWTEFEREKSIPYDKRVNNACHRWQLYESDIELLDKLEMNANRFSIEWSKIEPKEGQFDQEAMNHYIAMIDEMIKRNITPVITLFHHTYPVWFHQKNAFESKQNNYYFMRYCLFVFNQLHKKVRIWITMNEPIGYALEGYYRGVYPPGKKSLSLAGTVAKNLLYAHVNVYKEFKKINREVQVGLTHIFVPLDPYSKWNPFEQAAARSFDYLVNKMILTFFQTGTFDWAFFVRGYNADAPKALDFFGINYYSHTTIKQTSLLNLKPQPRMDETLLDCPSDGRVCKVLYPEGMYRSIVNVSKLKVPIYITENGISSLDPELRNEYVQKHLYVLSRALSEGYDIRGYFFWTLMDCFCWRKGYADKYGIYQVDFKTQERILRPGNEMLLSIVKNFSCKCSE